MRNFTRPGLVLAAVLSAVTAPSIWLDQSLLYTACLPAAATVTAAVWWVGSSHCPAWQISLMLAIRVTPGVHTVPPEWFRRRVLPAYGDSWVESEAELRDDPYEVRRLSELEAELIISGIQRPVSVYFEHWWSRRLTVADGMHRAITAMRLGLPIPVGRNYQLPEQHHATDVYRVTAGEHSTEDLMDAVMSLASFRLSSGPWIQTDSTAGAGARAVEAYLPNHPDLRDQIAVELEERLRTSGVDACVEFSHNEAN